MITSKKDLGEQLQRHLILGKNAREIGNWAHHIFFTSCRELNPELKEILEQLLLMEEGKEFEYTERELNLLVKLLINESKNPIQQLNATRLKREDLIDVFLNDGANQH